MPKLSDYTFDQLLAIETLADAPPDIQALPRTHLDEMRLLQIRELMRVYNGMIQAVDPDDARTWVYGDEAEAYFNEHVWPWHINLLLKLLDEARAGHYAADPTAVPQPAAGDLPFPYNVYVEGDLESDNA